MQQQNQETNHDDLTPKQQAKIKQRTGIALKVSIIVTFLVIVAVVFTFFSYRNRGTNLDPVVEKTVSFLSVSGQDIVDERGDKVFLKGVNFGNWLLWEGCSLRVLACLPWPEYKLRAEMEKRMSKKDVDKFFDGVVANLIQEEDFQRVKEMGLNFIRLNFHYRYVKKNVLTELDQAVQWASKYGVYVILNMHATPGAQAPAYFADSDGTAYLWQSSEYQEQFLNLWEVLAKRYKGNPIIAGYELINEPVAQNGQDLTDLYSRAIKIVRGIDPNHIIFLDGNDYASDFDVFKEPLADNAVYVFHTYDTTFAELRTTMKKAGYLSFRDKYNIPLMCNEYDNYEFSEYFEDNNIFWAPWTYKSMYEDLPFYSMPDGHPWRNWMDEVDSNNLVSKDQVKDSILEIVNQSILSDEVKKILISSLTSQGLSAFRESLSLVEISYSNEVDEFKDVYNQVYQSYLDYNLAADSGWLDVFADSLNSMSNREFDRLMESLQTKYWQGGSLGRY